MVGGDRGQPEHDRAHRAPRQQEAPPTPRTHLPLEPVQLHLQLTGRRGRRHGHLSGRRWDRRVGRAARRRGRRITAGRQGRAVHRRRSWGRVVRVAGRERRRTTPGRLSRNSRRRRRHNGCRLPRHSRRRRRGDVRGLAGRFGRQWRRRRLRPRGRGRGRDLAAHGSLGAQPASAVGMRTDGRAVRNLPPAPTALVHEIISQRATHAPNLSPHQSSKTRPSLSIRPKLSISSNPPVSPSSLR